MSSEELTIQFCTNPVLDFYLKVTCFSGGLGGIFLGVAICNVLPPFIDIMSLLITIPIGMSIGMRIGPIVPPGMAIVLLYSWYKQKLDSKAKNKDLPDHWKPSI